MNIIPIVILCTFVLSYGIVSAIREQLHPMRWGQDGWLMFGTIVLGVALNAGLIISAVRG